jgi:hypothetical protein
MPVGDLVDRGDVLVDVEDRLLVGPVRGVTDERRMAVLRDRVGVAGAERRLDLPGLGKGVQGPLDVLDDRTEGGVVCREGLRLDEDHLAELLDRLALLVHDEAGLVEDAVGRARLADVGVVLVDVDRRERHAHEDGRRDEREPAEDGGLPVVGAPTAHPGREGL